MADDVRPRFNDPGDDAPAMADAYERLAALAEGGAHRVERRFTTRIVAVDGGQVSLTTLDDDFHAMRVALRVDEHGTIIDAGGLMLRHPFHVCPRAVVSLRGLIGVDVEGGGAQRRARETLPRDEACLHLADMVAIAIRAFRVAHASGAPDRIDDDGRRAYLTLMPSVRDTCVSFAVEP